MKARVYNGGTKIDEGKILTVPRQGEYIIIHGGKYEVVSIGYYMHNPYVINIKVRPAT